jgi:hypothetical protein
MRYALISMLLMGSLVLTECATSGSSKHHQQNHKKTFRTSAIRANFSLSEGSLGNTIPILYQVQIQCKSADCKSPKGTLSFSLERDFRTVYLSKRGLTIHAGDKKYHWNRHEWLDIRNSPPVYGQIISVHLKKSEIKQIAESKNVTGTLAGIHFKWTYENRKPVRSLLDKIEKGQ